MPARVARGRTRPVPRHRGRATGSSGPARTPLRPPNHCPDRSSARSGRRPAPIAAPRRILVLQLHSRHPDQQIGACGRDPLLLNVAEQLRCAAEQLARAGAVAELEFRQARLDKPMGVITPVTALNRRFGGRLLQPLHRLGVAALQPPQRAEVPHRQVTRTDRRTALLDRLAQLAIRVVESPQLRQRQTETPACVQHLQRRFRGNRQPDRLLQPTGGFPTGPGRQQRVAQFAHPACVSGGSRLPLLQVDGDRPAGVPDRGFQGTDLDLQREERRQ